MKHQSAVFVADEIAPRFDAPTAIEKAVIEAFVERSPARQAFGRIVARGLADISQNSLETFDVVERVFKSLNSALEDELERNIPTFERWSTGSFQPRILARAVGAIEQLDDLIYRGCGSPKPVVSEQDDLTNGQTLEQFFYKRFLYEVSLSLISETPPNVSFAAKHFFLDARAHDRRAKRATHAIIMIGASGEWEQALARVNDGHLADFVECISEGRRTNLREYGEFIIIWSRDRFIKQVRELEQHEQQPVLRNFILKFDKDKLYRKIGILNENVVKSSDLEAKIFDRIIKAALDLKETVSPNRPTEAVRTKLRIIDDFVERNPGEPVSGLIFETFPGLNELVENAEARGLTEVRASGSKPELAEPPVMWADRVSRSRNQDPIVFLREQYIGELQAGMTIGQLRVKDPGLGAAVIRWIDRYGMPDDLNLDLRTRQQRNDEELQKLHDARLEGREPTFTQRELMRLQSAEHRRRKK